MPYVYDNTEPAEQERLASLEANLDPPTFSVLAEIGVGPGWRCWEVGGGAGSVARRLAELVVPDGLVLATDVDTALLAHHAGAGVEVRQHDVVADPLPDQRFDLVHARLVLEHLPARDQVLARLAKALAPGGVLVVEDSAEVGFRSVPLLPEVEHLTEAWHVAVREAGWDTE